MIHPITVKEGVHSHILALTTRTSLPSTCVSVPCQGISAIVASWALSPVLSGVVATLLFFVVRTLVLRSEHSLNRSMIAFPVLVTVTIAVNGGT